MCVLGNGSADAARKEDRQGLAIGYGAEDLWEVLGEASRPRPRLFSSTMSPQGFSVSSRLVGGDTEDEAGSAVETKLGLPLSSPPAMVAGTGVGTPTILLLFARGGRWGCALGGV